jgi:hypothetical protein
MNQESFLYGTHNHIAAEFFDLFRLSRAKDVVDLSPNTLRAYSKQGLPFHRRGKVVFVSRRELDDFIRNKDVGTTESDSNAVSSRAN